MKPGWYYFGRKMVSARSSCIMLSMQTFVLTFVLLLLDLQDVADFEWMMWFSTFREHILFALSGHVLFAKICSMLAPQVHLLTY